MAVRSVRNLKPERAGRVLRWLFTGLVAAFCVCLVLFLMGRALRRIAIGQIVELTNARVETRLVDVDLDGSVFIEKLVIRPHKEQEYDDAILKADTVYARFGMGSVLLLRPRLKEIHVNDFVLDAQCDLDTGRWNIGALKIKAPKSGSGKMPVVWLEKGTLKYSKVSNGEVKAIASLPVDAKFGPAEQSQDGYRFNIATAEISGGFGKSSLTGFWRPGRVTIAGGVSSADIPAFEKVWTIYVSAAELNYDRSNDYSLKLVVKDLQNKHRPVGDVSALGTPGFLKKFGAFAALQKFFSRYDPQGRVDINFKASGNLSKFSESKFAGKIYCRDVSICDRKFPYPISHMVGQIDFTERRAELNNLCGEHGDVKVTINGWSNDFGAKRRYDITVVSDNMVLDDDLYNALGPRQKKFWSISSPRGLAAINHRTVCQSQTDKESTLTVDLLGAEAVYRDFPYPLKNLTGRLLFDHDDIAFSDVVSEFDGRRITIDGKVRACNTDQPTCEFAITARNIPLDSTLAASLSDRQKYLYDRLNVSGFADAEVRVLTSEDALGLTDVTANVNLKEASLRPDDFPLAVSGVSANAVVTRDSIDIKNLNGSSGGGTVSLTGRISPGLEAEELSYGLVLSAEHVRLDDELFGLLPGSLRELVSELHPKGKINYQVDLNKAAGTGEPDYKIVVDCLGNSFDSEPFPYPLENITGSLMITTEGIGPGGITAAGNARASPGATTVKITGRIAQAADGISGGRFDLDLENIRILSTAAGEKYIDFAGVAGCKGCNLNTKPAITELDALLKIRGLYKAGQGFDKGEATLFADSLKIKGKSLTGLKADIYYDQGRQGWLSKSLIADCYEGKVVGKLEFKEAGEKTLEYLLQVGFDNVGVSRFLGDATLFCGDTERDERHLDSLSGAKHEVTADNTNTSGKMSGSFCLAGQMADDDHSRIGRCRLEISNVQVGEASLLARLFCLLKLTEPKDFAFDRILIDSYVKHNKVYLECLDLSGEAAAFSGSGWVDFQDRTVELILFARGARLAMAEPSVLESLAENLGSAVVRMEVTGDLCQPKVTVKTLPVVEDALGILGGRPVTPNH